MSKIIFIKRAVSNDPLGLRPFVKTFQGGNLFFERSPVRTVCTQMKQVSPQIYIIISTGNEIHASLMRLPFKIITYRKCRRIRWRQG